MVNKLEQNNKLVVLTLFLFQSNEKVEIVSRQYVEAMINEDDDLKVILRKTIDLKFTHIVDYSE